MDPESARRLKARLVPLHARKPPPRPGEWLAAHTEPGQTFDDYVASMVTPVCARYRTLYLQPIGEVGDATASVLHIVATGLRAFFGFEVHELSAIALGGIPAFAQRQLRGNGQSQLLTSYLLDHLLRPRRPADAAAVLGLTTTDLWPGSGWNFVFGQASLQDRVGVYSTYRYGDPAGPAAERRQFLRRTVKVATHEGGHMLGLSHCTFYECGMNGSNSLAESDTRPVEFCPECQAKLWWTCGYAAPARCEALMRFAREQGFGKEAVYWGEALPLLTATS
jgi:archaemetzincin